MRKFLVFVLLLAPCFQAFATDPPDPVTDPDNYYFVGFWAGFTFGALAFSLRLVRQIGRHSPEV